VTKKRPHAKYTFAMNVATKNFQLQCKILLNLQKCANFNESAKKNSMYVGGEATRGGNSWEKFGAGMEQLQEYK
jgi:hypothetical protein